MEDKFFELLVCIQTGQVSKASHSNLEVLSMYIITTSLMPRYHNHTIPLSIHISKLRNKKRYNILNTSLVTPGDSTT